MLAVRLTPDVERRLEPLAARTGRTKTFYAREAIAAHLDDLEDFDLAEERMKEFREGGAIPLERLKQSLTWAVEFHSEAEKELRKLDPQAAARFVRTLETRIAPLDDPRTLGAALKANMKAIGAGGSGTTASSRASRMRR